MRISDWSSDVCSSDLRRNDLTIVVALLRAGGTRPIEVRHLLQGAVGRRRVDDVQRHVVVDGVPEGGMQFLLGRAGCQQAAGRERSDDCQRPHCRSEEHKSELQSLMRISYAVY